MKTIFVDAVDCFVSKDGEIYKEMHELLETYPNKKILLSNASQEQYKQFGLDKMPYEVFSLQHDPEKTSRAYYVKMLEFFGIAAADSIYFEHNLEAVKAAQSVGIKTHYFDKGLPALKTFLDRQTKIRHFYELKQRIKRFWRELFPHAERRKEERREKPRAEEDRRAPVFVATRTPAPVRPPRKQYIRRCFTTHKFMFTREQAENKKTELMRQNKAEKLRVYKCQFCEAWHLTHKKDLMKAS